MEKIEISAYDLAQRFIGIKEAPGSKSNPQVLAMLRLDETWPEGDEAPWCWAAMVSVSRYPASNLLGIRRLV